MSGYIQTKRVNHLNMVLEDYDAAIAHFQELYGAEFLLDLSQKEWRAFLIQIGHVIFEVFVPHAFLLNARYGQHYVGIEYQAAGMKEVREVVATQKVRIIRDLDVAVHAHPVDCFGIAFEFWDGAFHDWDWKALDGNKMKPLAYWQDEHPLGITGLLGYTVVAADSDAACRFFKSLLGADVIYDEVRPGVGGRAKGLQVADALVEILSPVGDGSIGEHLRKFGDGIRSTVFRVRDIEQARRYFTERGIALTASAAPNGFAVPAEANLGVIFEFSE